MFWKQRNSLFNIVVIRFKTLLTFTFGIQHPFLFFKKGCEDR